MEYAILSDTCRDDLVSKVNTNIELGWTPLGGVAVTEIKFEYEFFYTFVQAMVRNV